MGLYMFILAMCCIAGWGLFEFYQHMQRKSTMEELSGPGEDNRCLNEIIRLVHTHALMGKDKAVTRNSVSKVTLMEDLNLRPRELKSYLGRLVTKNIIKEDIDSVTITPFGVQFYTVFSDDKLNLSPPRR